MPGASEISTKGSILDPRLFDISQGSGLAGQPAAQGYVSDKAFEEMQKLQGGAGVSGVDSEPPPQRKLPWIIDIFLYPASKPGLTMVGIFIGVPLLMGLFVRFLKLLAVQFPPFYVFAVFFLVISLIINIVILLYKYWYLGECVRDSAGGQIRAPETIAVTPCFEIFSSFLRIFVCVIIFSAPVFYYLLKSGGVDRNGVSLFWFVLLFSQNVMSEIGKGGTAFHLLLLFAVFFFPMTVLSVVMFDSFRGLNPILIVRSIFRTFFYYCGLVVLISLLSVPIILLRKFVVTEVISGRPGLFLNLPTAAGIYLMLVVAHLLGRFYWKYQEKLNWDV
jgi:hypothetical protein